MANDFLFSDRGATVRRAITVPTVASIAGGLALWSPLWLPTALAHDVLRAPRRLPATRLLSFALVWSALETTGVAASTALWALGQSHRAGPNYALQRWWTARLLDGLRVLGDLRLEVEGEEALLADGPIVLCGRHVNHADSLLPAWILAGAGRQPRYVLKRDLLVDPCLDIVGNRVPNHFVDRDADDSAAEIGALEALGRGMGARDAAVIFPEGALVSAARRERALARIRDRDPERAARLAGLRYLAPPRAGGTAALLAGSPGADLVFLAHTGFEGFDRLAHAPSQVPFREPIRVRLERVPRPEVPVAARFGPWLDRAWLAMDLWVADHLGAADGTVAEGP